MYGHESGENPPTYTYKVPEEIRGFIRYFHQHVTEQVEFMCISMSFFPYISQSAKAVFET